MSCPHCNRRMAVIERQADEIRRLKRELGFQREAGNVGALMIALDVSATQARLLLAMYAGGGKPVRHEMLADCVEEDADSNTVAVHIYRIRKKLGDEAVQNAPGHGYGLSIPMVSRVLAILEPPEIQDARSAG